MGILKWIHRILSILAILCFTGVILIVLMQIVSRYLPFSYVWTEELTRYLFLYGICFGAPVALLQNEFIAVDLIISRTSAKVKKVFEICINFTILILSVIMVKQSYTFIELGKLQKSATLPFQMSAIHASIFIMSIFLVLFSLVKIYFVFRDKKNPYEVEGGGEI